jgi:hypothetical protein
MRKESRRAGGLAARTALPLRGGRFSRTVRPAARGREKKSSRPTGPAYVTLTFDRAVSITGVHPAAISVNDGEFADATLVSPTTVRVTLELDSDAGPGVTLTASPDNGIVAADDGAAWAGVSDVGLPFP